VISLPVISPVLRDSLSAVKLLLKSAVSSVPLVAGCPAGSKLLSVAL